MVSITTAVLYGYPLLVLVIGATYVYMDAPEYGMDPVKWAALALFVPIFGFFAYLLERSEQTPDSDREMFEDGVFEIHESRADDTRLTASTGEEDPDDPEKP